MSQAYLAAKLIARKCQNFQALAVVFGVKLRETLQQAASSARPRQCRPASHLRQQKAFDVFCELVVEILCQCILMQH